MLKATRRDYLNAVAAVAAAEWAAEDLDVENVDEWEPLDSDIWETGVFTPETIFASGYGEFSSFGVEDDQLNDRTAEVFYDTDTVNLAIEGQGESLRSGALAALTPEQARALGVALYQAGEELARRREAEGYE